MSQAEIIEVFIASPAEAAHERHLVFDVLTEWNSLNASQTGMVFIPTMWEIGLRSSLRQAAQETINVALLDPCRLLVAVFGRSLGSKRGKGRQPAEALYASVEELFRFMHNGRDAWAYFSDAPIRRSAVDAPALAEVEQLERRLRKIGAVFDFGSDEELRNRLKEDLNSFARTAAARVADDPTIEKLRWSALQEPAKQALYDRFNALTPRHHLPLSPVATAEVQSELEKRFPIDLSILDALLEEFDFGGQNTKRPTTDPLLAQLQGIRVPLADKMTEAAVRGATVRQKQLFRALYEFLKTPDPNQIASEGDVNECDVVLVPGARRGHTYRIDTTLEILQRSGAAVILSGSHPIYDPNQLLPIGEAEAMEFYLRSRLGSQPARVHFENRAKTTLESLTHSLTHLIEIRKEVGRPLNLIAVTSPYHMHRLLRQCNAFYASRGHIINRVRGKLCSATFDFNVFNSNYGDDAMRAYGIGVYVQELFKLYGGRAVGEF